MKSIKYICKYVHKGNDKAIFAVQNVKDNYEITCFQMGRYVSSNEAIWCIFTFPIHERDPAVTHLAMHLKNGQRVFSQNRLHYNKLQHLQKQVLLKFSTFVIGKMLLINSQRD